LSRRCESVILRVTTQTLTGGIHIFAAFKPNDIATAQQTLLLGGGGTSYIQFGTSSAIAVKLEGVSAFNLSLPRALSLNRWNIMELIVSGGTATVYVNGQAGGSSAVASDSIKVNLIGHAGGSNYWQADVGALLFHQGTPLDATARQIVRNALSLYVSSVFYVSTSGSDSNDGYTPSTPFATILKAQNTRPYPGDQILLNRGDVFSEMGATDTTTSFWPWNSAAAPIVFGAYGSGPRPILKGSNPITGWTLVSGTEYKAALAYTALNAFRILATPLSEANVQKLILGTAGSLTSGQFGTSSGFVHVNIGIDPSGATIEVPRLGEKGWVYTNTNSWIIQDLGVYMFEQSGITITGGTNQAVTRCDLMFNGDDGFDLATPGARCDITHCTIVRNGLTRTIFGGPGDGISYHSTSGGLIGWNHVRDNEKGGITNLEGCDVTVVGNYIDGCNNNAFILATTDTPGTHNWYYNIIVVRSQDTNKFGIRRDGSGNTSIINAVNNTIYSTTGTGTGIDAADLAKNNIVVNFTTGINAVTTAGYNDVFGCTTAYSTTTPGTGAINADPLFNNAAAADFTLLNGSPCIAAGVSGAGPTKDWNEAVPPNPPNIGAR
jgi:hypothetical protein